MVSQKFYSKNTVDKIHSFNRCCFNDKHGPVDFYRILGEIDGFNWNRRTPIEG